jgi:DDE superfamily endonuclease/Archaeal putative transposase ISC1217
MLSIPELPTEALPLLLEFAPTFTRPTFQRFQLLLAAAILTTGRRTVSNLLRTVRTLAPGAPSSYHRVLSQAHWSGLRLAAILARFVLRRFGPPGRIRVVGDDTVDEHRGKKVYGKARHRDPVRSSHSYTAYRYGHKWVVLAVLVPFPFTSRPWALPLLVALYRSKEDNRRRRRPHKTPAELMRLLLRVLLRWFPDRPFVFAGDTGFGNHELAAFASQQGGRLTLVSRFYPDAQLFELPPVVAGKRPAHRPRKKGDRLPSPQEGLALYETRLAHVRWYGGGWRDVAYVTGVGHWYRSGAGLVAARWVYVHDLTATHRDDYLYSTDPEMSAEQIIEEYTGRWNIETLFEEMRSYLGLETTRGRLAQTVLRAAPCLFGLYGVVALLYEGLQERGLAVGQVQWAQKQGVTFSDAITAVRRWLWADWVFARVDHDQAFAKLPDALKEVMLYALAPAA